MTDKELQELIRLKRFEQPEEGYFDDFLTEFQQRQRSEILNTSARGLFLERVKAWFGELGSVGSTKSGRLALGAGLACAACAAVAMTVHFLPSSGQNQPHSMANTHATDVAAPSSETLKEYGASSVSNEAQYSTVVLEQMRPIDFSQQQTKLATEQTVF